MFFRKSKKSIPDLIKKRFLTFFPKAINIEWNKMDHYFEALFYFDKVEHIAKLTDEGNLIEYKKNIRITEIPKVIQEKAAEQGEIMSAIIIFPDQEVKYEIITRNKNLSRDLLLLDNQGNLLEKKTIS